MQVEMWRQANRGKNITKYELIRAILPALEKGLGNKSLIKEGFRASGLYVEGKGFDPSQVDFNRMKASEVFAQEEPGGNDGAELLTQDEASDNLPPITSDVQVTRAPEVSRGHTVSETSGQAVTDVSLGTALVSNSSSDHSLFVTSEPDIPMMNSDLTAHSTTDHLLVTSDHTALVSTDDRDPTVVVTGEHSTLVSSLSRVHNTSEISGPDVTEPGELTAPITSLFRDYTLPMTSSPAVAVSPELSAPVPGVSSVPPVREFSDAGVSDNPLSQFVIPLEDRKRRSVME